MAENKKVELSRRNFLGLSASALLAACAGLQRSAVQPVTKSVAIPGQVQSTLHQLAPVEVLVPGNKRIKIAFQFSPHDSEEHGRSIGPLLEKVKPHVVCIENAETDEQDARKYEDEYARGYVPGSSFYRALYETMRKNQVQRMYVLERFSQDNREFIDFEQQAQLVNSVHLAESHFRSGGWKDAISLYRTYLDEFSAKALIRREKVAKVVIANLYDSLIARFPELEKEREIRVAIKYGSAHTPLYAAARKAGFAEVTREIQKPFYFFPYSAYTRRATFGLKKQNEDEDIARVFIGDHLARHALENLGVNYSNSSAFGNLASRGISLTVFRRVSNRLAKMESITDKNVGVALVDALRKEGVKLPRTKEEVHAFLERKRIPLARE